MNPQQKAANTKAEKAAKRVWEDVKKSKQRTGCKCALRKGMDHDDLRLLKGGCTDTPTHPGGRWTCPTLDKYRRLVPQPVVEIAV